MDGKKQNERYLRAIEKQTGVDIQRTYRVDGYVNALNKYGTKQDTIENYRFVPELPTPDMELERLYEGNGIFARIVDAPAIDATRKGFELAGVKDEKLIDFYKESLQNLHFMKNAETAIKWQRLFGGALVVMLINDGRGIEDPVDWDNVKSIDDMFVYDRSVVFPSTYDLYRFSMGDPFEYGTGLGKPKWYFVSSKYGSFRVHHSRCLVFRNGKLPERCSYFQYEMWGIPEYLRIKRELRNVQIAHDAAPRFLEKSVQPIYKMQNLNDQLGTEGGENEIVQRLEAISLSMGLLDTMVIDANGEDFDYKGFSYTGVSDIINSTCNMLSAVTGIPQTILFGRSPAGMNATGSSDLENYYTKIEGIQKDSIEENLRYLLKLIFRAGVNTKGIDGHQKIDEIPKIEIKFEPLWSLNETEQASLEATKAGTQSTKAQTAIAYINAGILDPNEVRKALAKEDDFDIETMLDNVPEDELFANMEQQQGGGDMDAMLQALMGGGGDQGAPQGSPQGAAPATPPTTPSATTPTQEQAQLRQATEDADTAVAAQGQTNTQGEEQNAVEDVLDGLKADYALSQLKEQYNEMNGNGLDDEGRATKTIDEGQTDGYKSFSEKNLPASSDDDFTHSPESLTNSAGNDASVKVKPETAHIGEPERELAMLKGEYKELNSEKDTDSEDVKEDDDAIVQRRLAELKAEYKRKNAAPVIPFDVGNKSPEQQILDGLKERYREEKELAYEKVVTGTAYAHMIDTTPSDATSCGVIVLHNGKLLTAVRESDAGKGLICSPGGHLEDGEDSEQAARRETEEEFAINPYIMFKIGRGLTDEESGLRPDIYVCTKFYGTPSTINTDELSHPKYYTLEQLLAMPEKLFPPFRDALRLFNNWNRDGYRLDADDDAEEETSETPVKGGGGNTHLPYGLCKGLGINLPENAKPHDAWEALAGKGIHPDDVYKELNKTGSVKEIVEKKGGEVEKAPRKAENVYRVHARKVQEQFVRQIPCGKHGQVG